MLRPRRRYLARAGDVAAVIRCLQEGEDIHQTVSLVNQNRQEVLGVTPLYLVSRHTRGFWHMRTLAQAQ